MINRRNLLRHELIGLPVMVMRTSNPYQLGITGTVVDETRNMLHIRTDSGDKVIPKYLNIFRFVLPDGAIVDVDGSALIMQPEKRISRKTQNT